MGYVTEQDRNSCSFYMKIGACRHGDKCSKQHPIPRYSQTILCSNMLDVPSSLNGRQKQERLNNFYEDFFCEAAKFGIIERVVICENVCDHLIGNVYAQFRYEQDAQKCVENFKNRWYDGRPVRAELCPVSDFREACCRQYDTNECDRGGNCNFIHARKTDPELVKELDLSQKKYWAANKRQRGDERRDDWRRR
jgi:splicing factor U2AF 35 kDa subunit